jgi:hypothetical protein
MDLPVKSELQEGIEPVTVHPSMGDTMLYVDAEREKKLLLKLDIYIAPVMTLIFLAAYLDRANIGNAASAGMTTDLKMSSGQLGSRLPQSPLYVNSSLRFCSDAVTLFYVTYVAFEVPCSLVMKKFHPGLLATFHSVHMIIPRL